MKFLSSIVFIIALTFAVVQFTAFMFSSCEQLKTWPMMMAPARCIK